MEDLDIFDLTGDEIDSEEEIFNDLYGYEDEEDWPDWHDSMDPYDIEYDI